MKKNILGGQSLFEIIFAFAIMALMVVAVVGMATVSVRNSSYSRNKTYAEKYSQEAYEWLRNERDTSWQAFIAHSTTGTPMVYCAPTLTPGVWSSPLGVCDEDDDDEKIANFFFREITLTKIDENNMDVIIRVYWTDSKGQHESNMTTKFSNWKPEAQ
jgi:hypothetical protein